MKMSSVGDMSSYFQNTRYNAQLKETMERLSYELTSGQKSNVAAAVSGDFAPLASIEHSLSSIKAYKTATNETALFLSSMQTALDKIQTDVSELSTGMLTAGNSGSSQMMGTAALDAFQRFESTVSALNTRVGGKSLFAGRSTDQPALAPSEDILADLQIAVSAATTSAGVIAAVDAYFDDVGGGFETSGYTGSANTMTDVRIAQDQTVSIDVKADDQEIRDTLKGMALGALIHQGTFAGDLDLQSDLLREAGTRMLEVDASLASVRANLGLTEGRVETASVRNDSEASALEIARTDMLSIDPYQVATELTETQSQLEALYTMTARLSQLSLADYI
ncbi:flagellin [Aliiroseovarius sp. PTFE2010]|uniref:flagellin n=1 Tax=Aliiroseovarius sp. PTFE2010 TaxID=3417190 RepID=UPI003CF4CE34